LTRARGGNTVHSKKPLVVMYTYYSQPWKMETGDDVRIHHIARSIAKHAKVVVYNLSHRTKGEAITVIDGVVYVSLPRRFYQLAARLARWKRQYDLDPLMKATHYIDELIAAVKLRAATSKADAVYVAGSMTLFSYLNRTAKHTIYDPLANYAQTLHLQSRHSILALLRYGLYLALHKLQLKHANHVVYPSEVDLENATKMFKLRRATVIPNPPPICYTRQTPKDEEKPHFVLLAGGKNKQNQEAVKATITVFNELPPQAFHLYITGPWQDYAKYVKHPSIELLGTVPEDKLKEVLAASHYGLAPIFHHAAGTFLKTLTYVAAGLHLITTPRGLIGIDKEKLRDRCIYLVKNLHDYREAVHRAIADFKKCLSKKPTITLCGSDDIAKRVAELIAHGQ